MIRSKKELVYDARDGVKKGIIEIDVVDYFSNKNISTYNIVDYVVFEDGSKMVINQKNYIMNNQQINDADVQLQQLMDFTGMYKTDREWTKIKLMLFQLTKSAPVYSSVSDDWELSE